MNNRINKAQRGLSLLEVLITIVILSLGLLSLAGLQMRLQVSEMEAYQRAQALILLDDMASRIAANRTGAANYVTGADSPVGVGMTCPTSTATTKDRDKKDWCDALQGASETSGTTKVGAFIGGRGCVEDLGAGQYMVTVAWQGMSSVSAPPDSVACGVDEYDDGVKCKDDMCRRVVTTIVRIATL